ncbi:hypothetical protein GH714_026253 [Hevea brasiliensis]|uniref:Uncharacterized protein n=1 Tax=Hevea brasiliensis TaxID=3981 RepID=A0A6A6KX75_HEVBR|nr:hypothetical protein GH714_026253 [Hevea brasiliensis]
MPEGLVENNIQDSNRQLETREGILQAGDSESFRDRIELEEADTENSSESGLSLKCPLCRGAVLGWEVVDEARKYLNLKKRSCSRESCSFVGNYQELRRHARRVHPKLDPLMLIHPENELGDALSDRQNIVTLSVPFVRPCQLNQGLGQELGQGIVEQLEHYPSVDSFGALAWALVCDEHDLSRWRWGWGWGLAMDNGRIQAVLTKSEWT